MEIIATAIPPDKNFCYILGCERMPKGQKKKSISGGSIYHCQCAVLLSIWEPSIKSTKMSDHTCVRIDKGCKSSAREKVS